MGDREIHIIQITPRVEWWRPLLDDMEQVRRFGISSQESDELHDELECLRLKGLSSEAGKAFLAQYRIRKAKA